MPPTPVWPSLMDWDDSTPLRSTDDSPRALLMTREEKVEQAASSGPKISLTFQDGTVCSITKTSKQGRWTWQTPHPRRSRLSNHRHRLHPLRRGGLLNAAAIGPRALGATGRGWLSGLLGLRRGGDRRRRWRSPPALLPSLRPDCGPPCCAGATATWRPCQRTFGAGLSLTSTAIHAPSSRSMTASASKPVSSR